MLFPSPLSLLCALFLFLPFAIVFTITTPCTPFSSTPRILILNLTKNPQISTLRPLAKAQLSESERPHHNKDIDDVVQLQLPLLSPPPPQLPPIKESTPPPMHEADDDEDDDSLFQLAARVNPNPKPLLKKLAFMFLANSPLPFAPLWELFFSHAPKNQYNIYIHADPTFNYTTPFLGVFADRVIPSKPTRRHTPTLIAAARRLISHALLHDESNYMFALLSPSCVPLHSFNFTYGVLANSRKSFIEILKGEPLAYVRWAARGKEVMLPEVKFEDFRIGSQFFVLKREHATIVARDRRLWSKFKIPCLKSNTCYPEEHFFPTLLSMVDRNGCVPATLTSVDWKGGGGHPRMYRKSDVGPELISALRKRRPRYGSNDSDFSVTKRHDPFLFARKFSADSLIPLMNIAKDVILKD